MLTQQTKQTKKILKFHLGRKRRGEKTADRRKKTTKVTKPCAWRGEAGPADEAPTPTLASAAPADSPHRTSAAAKTPTEAPETHQKIDYDVFRVQTGQSLPDRHTATQPTQSATLEATLSPVPAIILPMSAEAQQRDLFRILQTEAVNCPGTVFTPGMNHPTESLYQMFTNMKGRLVADPDANIVAKCLSDYVKPHDVPMIPAEEAFEKYIRILWELIIEAAVKGGKDAVKTCDFIVQRAAYPYVMENWDEISHIAWWTPDRLIADALNRDRRKNFFTHLVGMLWEVYSQLGYGWDVTPLFNAQTWKVELERYGFQGARRELFPSFFHNQASQTQMGKSLAKNTGTGKKARHVASKVEPILQERRDAAERLSADTVGGSRSGTPGERLLLHIEEKIGDKRFNLWFGQDTKVSVDESNKEIVFAMRNVFAISTAKRHLAAEIDEAIAELHPGFTARFIVTPKAPAMSQAEADVAMRRLADACNAEAAEQARLKQERIAKHKEEARKMREEHEAAHAAWQEKLLKTV